LARKSGKDHEYGVVSGQSISLRNEFNAKTTENNAAASSSSTY
jgi:hypothetical protein